MKIALAQLNFHIANLSGNRKKMESAISEALADKADLIVFSELSVCGYPPLDLLEQKDFIDACQAEVEYLATLSKDIGIVVGAPAINPNAKGKKLFNAAFFLAEGSIQQRVYKTLLPTYDIFDEYRYFEPNTEFNLVEFKGHRFALTICEDLWDDQPVDNAFARTKLYTRSPMDELSDRDPEFIINISASPFAWNKLSARREVMCQNARKYHLPVFYANQVGANTELIFDGESMVVHPSGSVVDQFNSFEEEVRIYELENLILNTKIREENKYENLLEEKKLEMIYKALILGIKDYFGKMGFKKACLGLSGGIDSALTLVLAVEALGAENLHVLLMPSKYSSDHSVDDSVKLANNLGISFSTIPIQSVVDSFEEQLKDMFKGTSPDITEENIQARTRGTLLMALSNKKGHILLNTSNKSEVAVGYSTLYGDMNGGLSVIGDVYKTDVYRLSEYVNRHFEVIPDNILRKPPSAELRPDQKDSDSLPDYELLDQILNCYIEKRMPVSDIVSEGFNEPLVHRIVQLVNSSEYKRFQSPPILRVSSKAFGMGRRIPLVARY
ncbi:MAG: NAD+ synthase [Bacteroidetes bacterium]|nr:NAD+ synthase [Bacteroidota bacterium]